MKSFNYLYLILGFIPVQALGLEINSFFKSEISNQCPPNSVGYHI